MTTTPSNAMPISYSVPDMTCDHCKSAIEAEVGKVAGVQSIDVDLQTKKVAILGGAQDAIVAAIDEAGFDVAL